MPGALYGPEPSRYNRCGAGRTHHHVMDLSIIIVSWNVRELLAGCLDSIAAAPLIRAAPNGEQTGATGPLTEVIVVDSASTDGTPDMLRTRYTWVHALPQRENIGFTRGSNLGLAAAKGRHVLLLNPDTVIHGDALGQMVAYLDAHPPVGIVGPRVLNPDGTTQSTRRRFLRPLDGFFESTWLQGYAPRGMLERFTASDLPDDGTFEVDWVQGCALMARRAVYEQIGELDTSYVMFFEETDWCRRAKAQGWQAVYFGTATITHYGGGSTEQVQAQKHIFFQQSKIRYYRKFHGWPLAFALWLFLLGSYLVQMALESVKALLGHKRPMRIERIHTYARVVPALAAEVRHLARAR